MEIKKALNILNLQENYTEEELKKAYRTLMLKYHPDKHPDSEKPYAEEKTKEINEAKDVLDKNLKSRNKNHHVPTNTNQTNNQNTALKEKLTKLKLLYQISNEKSLMPKHIIAK